MLNCVAQLRSAVPRAKLIVCNAFTDGDSVVDLLKAGVSGCLLKSAPMHHLTTAIAEVANGRAWFSPECARLVVDYFEQLPSGDGSLAAVLTQREIDVMILARRGLGHKQIGAQLGLSYDTVRTHFRNIYRKLECRSRSEAVAKYYGF